MPFMLSTPVLVSAFQVSEKNSHFKFLLTEMSTLRPQRIFLVKNTSSLHQFEVSVKHRHFRSDLTAGNANSARLKPALLALVGALILVNLRFLVNSNK